MKALDFIQIFASNVRRMDFRLSSAQVILAIIAGYRRHSTITENDAAAPQHRYKHFAGPHRAGLRGSASGLPSLCLPLYRERQATGRKPAGQNKHSRTHERSLLSTEEKRRWLARVFRDTDGEYSQADKSKALVEDTKLAALQQEEERGIQTPE